MRRLLAALVPAALLVVPLFAPFGASSDASVVAHLPAPLVGGAAATVNGTTYLLGGRYADGNYSDGILAFDGSSVSAAGTLPSAGAGDVGGARYAASAAALDGVVYLFGGATMKNGSMGGQPAKLPAPVADVVAFDPATGAARTTADRLPMGAWGMSVVTMGDVAYLFGGFTLDVSTYQFVRHDWVLRFDPSQPEGQRLTQLQATLPYPVQDAAAARVGTHAYLLGGLADNGTANLCPGRYFSDGTGQQEYQRPSLCLTDEVIDVDLAAPSARVAPFTLPQRLQFAQGSASNGIVYVMGGLQVDNNATNAIYAIDPATGQQAADLHGLPQAAFGSGIAQADTGTLLLGGRTGPATALTDSIVLVPSPAVDPATAPQHLGARANGAAIDLSWDAPPSGADAYRVWRDSALLAETNATAYHDDAPRGEHVYEVEALTGGAPGDAAVAYVDTRVAPSAPQGLTATPQGIDLARASRVVKLAWSAPADDGGAPLFAALVVRTGALATTMRLVPWTTTFTDEAPLADGDATYSVAAVTEVGTGPDATVSSPLASAIAG